MEIELTEFCAGERVPVLTFGSMTYESPGEFMERLVRAWPRDRKIIVQRGWAQFPALAEDGHIKVIGKVSHDQLFRFASVIIHHGGAGTTASALHAGRPQIVVPHIGDQNFFGSEVERLACGFRIGRKRWPETLQNAVDRVRATPEMSKNAERVAGILAAENGPQRAIEELEDFVANARTSVAVRA